MSWSVYDGPLEFQAGPSRSLGAYAALGHLCVAGAIFAAGLPPILLIAVLFSLARAIATARRPLGARVRCIAWSAACGWERVHVSGNREAMELRGSSVVTNGAMFLHWDTGQGRWRVVVPRDALGPDAWRRKRVIVGLHEGRDRMPAAEGIATPAGRTTGTAPGLCEWRMDSPGFRGTRPDGHEKQRPVAGREGPAR